MTDVKYSMATSADYDEIIEHANFVFSYAHCPHEFKTLIPKAYGEARTMWPEHFIARENGRIRGLVGLLPFEQRVLDERLKVGFIGTVSVHPYSRGMGHMKKCMAMSTEYAHTHGIDIMALGGQRQRYEYYGYESGGQSRSYQLTATNCRHALKDVDTTGLSFVPFEQAREHIAALHAIYEQSPVAGARPVELFEQICGTWRKQPYAIMLNDCPTGYAIASSDHRSISELRLADVGLLQAVLKAYLKRFELDSVSIDVPPYLPDYARALSRLCEGCTLEHNEMFMICNYERVVSAYLKLKQRIEGALPEGRVVLGITGINGDQAPRSLEIAVQSGEVICRFGDLKPDIVLDTLAAQSLLLSPFTFVDMTALPLCARAYFPLPAYIESADGF